MTKSIVTKPAEGIDAAPMEATVAVKLKQTKSISMIDIHLCHLPNDNQLTNTQMTTQ